MARRVQRRPGVKSDTNFIDIPKEVLQEAEEKFAEEEKAEAEIKPEEAIAEEPEMKETEKPDKKARKKTSSTRKPSKLDAFREPDTSATLPASILSTLLIAVFGGGVGIVAQAAEYFGANSTIWWQDIIKDMQMNVVFTKFPIWFLLGLTVAVCSQRPLKAAINEFVFFLFTIVGRMAFPRVFPEAAAPEHIGTWVLITVISVPLALIFWYAKSRSVYSIIFDGIIIGVLAAYCFDCGMIYFHMTDVMMDLFNAIIVSLVVIVLASGIVQIVVSLIFGIAIALLLGPVIQMQL